MEQAKRYRAVLTGVPQKNTDTGLAPIPQCFGSSYAVMTKWGEDVLKGFSLEQFPHAFVAIYECREAMIGTVVPKLPEEKKKTAVEGGA